MFDVLLTFGPTAPPVCEFTGGPRSGRGGAPPDGHPVSAARACPPEEVRHINGVKQISWSCFLSRERIVTLLCSFTVTPTSQIIFKCVIITTL